MPGDLLDDILPTWQFREYHTRRIAAPPDRVFDAIRAVRADEIFLFHALTWIRRCGRRTPESILDVGAGEPIVDAAIRGGFLLLADDPPRELVLGKPIAVPRGFPRRTVDTFGCVQPPGVVLAAMNFRVRPDGEGSILSTETRVFASGAAARRKFAAYWAVIYTGSAFIRRMWLRAIERRAIGAGKC